MHKNGWIGVDLDGTLALYDGWKGEDHIGEPVPLMLERVKKWVAEGIEVRIMTARYHNGRDQIIIIKKWLVKHGLPQLKVTATKDFSMYQLWDDRCVQVIPNTGERADGEDGK